VSLICSPFVQVDQLCRLKRRAATVAYLPPLRKTSPTHSHSHSRCDFKPGRASTAPTNSMSAIVVKRHVEHL